MTDDPEQDARDIFEVVNELARDLGRPMYYDRGSHPIAFETWAALFEYGDAKRSQLGYRIVRKTWIEGANVEVSTVWLGIDHSFLSDVPLIFESMVFSHHEPVEIESSFGPYTKDSIAGFMERYSTEEEALDGHRRIVRALREGRPLA